MTSLPDSSTNPLRLRLRPDLEFQSRRTGGRRRWVIRDPLTRRHFQFQEEEYALAALLDGQRSLADIGKQFERDWPLLRFSAARFQAFLAQLHRDGLLVDDSPGHARVLRTRRERRHRGAWLQAPGHLLAIRLPGVNPQRFLDAAYPWVRWCFAPLAVLTSLTLMATALLIVALHPAEVHQRLPDLHSWLQPRQLWLVAAVLAGAKLLHELGHAFACKHFGGECREMGILLLVFTPCLYCDVSDAWMIPDRWRRAIVAAAGMYVEGVLAAASTLIWWNSEPGWLNRVCLLVMGVCGVSTLVFNGNPLLRYDGYFLLSDLLDVPNLWQRSRAAVQATAARWCLGMRTRPAEDALSVAPGWLLVYGTASGIYRAVVLVACLMFLGRLLASWHLERVGWLLGATVAGGALMPGIMLAFQRFNDPLWKRGVSRSRLGLTAGLAVVGLLVAFFVPLPCRVRGPALLQVEGATPVYVTVPGMIQETAVVGADVRPGDVVARLENLELTRELARWTGELQVHEARVAHLESSRGDDPAASARLPSAREALAGVRDIVAQRQRDHDRLVLKSTVAGTVLAPPSIDSAPRDDQELPTWSGTPLDPQNRGGHLENGTLICWVGDVRRREAVVYVPETEIEQANVGQTVRLRFAAWPGRVFEGLVKETAQIDVDELPRELTRGDDAASRRDARGIARPLETSYQVRVSLVDDDLPLLNRVRGAAKIEVAPQSLISRLRRAARKTFGWGP